MSQESGAGGDKKKQKTVSAENIFQNFALLEFAKSSQM